MSRPPVDLASVIAGLGHPTAHRCDCGATLPRPGKCKGCQGVEDRERKAEDIARRVKMRIPAVYRWGRLDIGGALETAMPNKAPIQAARAWMVDESAPPFFLIRGVTHSYKSTLACACATYDNEAGRDGFFVLAADTMPLRDKPPQSREQVESRSLAFARLADFRSLVVVDDLAKVLAGAPGDGPMAAWLRGDICAALSRRWQAKARTIVTTTMRNRATAEHSAPGILELFGEDMLARLTDPKSAAMVRCERPAERNAG